MQGGAIKQLKIGNDTIAAAHIKSRHSIAADKPTSPKTKAVVKSAAKF